MGLRKGSKGSKRVRTPIPPPPPPAPTATAATVTSTPTVSLSSEEEIPIQQAPPRQTRAPSRPLPTNSRTRPKNVRKTLQIPAGTSATARKASAPFFKRARQLRKNAGLTSDPVKKRKLNEQAKALEAQAIRAGNQAHTRKLEAVRIKGQERKRASIKTAQSRLVQSRTQETFRQRDLAKQQLGRQTAGNLAQEQKIRNTLSSRGIDITKLQKATPRFVDKPTTNPRQRAEARAAQARPLSEPSVIITGGGQVTRSAPPKSLTIPLSQPRTGITENIPIGPQRPTSIITPGPALAIEQPQKQNQFPFAFSLKGQAQKTFKDTKPPDPNRILQPFSRPGDFFRTISRPILNIEKSIADLPRGFFDVFTGKTTPQKPSLSNPLGLPIPEATKGIKPTGSTRLFSGNFDELLDPKRRAENIISLGSEALFLASGAGGFRGTTPKGIKPQSISPPTEIITNVPKPKGRVGKSERVFRPTNPFREKVPSDIFAKDTASIFREQRISLGKGLGKLNPKNSFASTVVPLGTGVGKVVEGSGSAGIGGLSGGGKGGPSDPNAFAPKPTRQGLELLQKQKPKAEPRADFIKLGEGKVTTILKNQQKQLNKQSSKLDNLFSKPKKQRSITQEAFDATLKPRQKQRQKGRTPTAGLIPALKPQQIFKQQNKLIPKLDQPLRQDFRRPGPPQKPPTKQTTRLTPIVPLVTSPIFPSSTSTGRPGLIGPGAPIGRGGRFPSFPRRTDDAAGRRFTAFAISSDINIKRLPGPFARVGRTSNVFNQLDKFESNFLKQLQGKTKKRKSKKRKRKK